MKTCYLILFIFLFSISSCSDDDFTTSEKIIIVDYKTQTGFDVVHNKERPYLRVKFQESATKWTLIYGISGFDYEEGYTYVLKVREKIIKKTSEEIQDLNPISYEFLELISKTKVIEPSE